VLSGEGGFAGREPKPLLNREKFRSAENWSAKRKIFGGEK
jgi:hypothetical protein